MGKEEKPIQYDKADQQNCPRRVVFYGRVSTELEAQISALKNQMNWYLELAEHHLRYWHENPTFFYEDAARCPEKEV